MKVLQILLLLIGLSPLLNGQSVSGYSETSTLTGTVYDANGSVIVNATVVAVDQKKQRFETKTNSDGIYTLSLPFNPYTTSPKFKVAKFEVFVISEGFERSVLNDFKVVPGKMQLDFALDVLTYVNTI